MQEVRIQARSPIDLAPVLGPERVEHLIHEVAPRMQSMLQGHSVINISSTAAGGGVAEAAVAYLRWEAARRTQVETWVAHLVDRYVLTADPYRVFEARRAGREAAWAWTALTETVA